MYSMLVVSILAVWALPIASGATNLLQDPDVEDPQVSTHWSCAGCTLTMSHDSHTGQQSLQVTNRKQHYSGISQQVPVKPRQRYSVQAWIKPLNQLSGYLYHRFSIKADVVNLQGHHRYFEIGASPYIQQSLGWQMIGGDFRTFNDTKTCKVYIEVPQTKVNYLFDSAVMEELSPLTNFESDADARIEKLRKDNVTVKFSGQHIPSSGLTIQLAQTYSEFIIGSAIDAKMITDPNYKKYQDYFYNNFEWGVLSNALKWTGTEHRQGQPNYDLPFKAVDTILAHGKKAKGHNIFWDVPNHVPKWQRNMTGSVLKPLMAKHIQEVVGGRKGKLLQWDVNNENLHGDFYEEKLHDPNITMWMFRETHKVDPSVDLFLNDYNIVNTGRMAFAYLKQARTFIESGVPVAGIGIQSHVTPTSPVDLTAYKFRLDQVAKAGLPIMITELDVNTPDEDLKAQVYEDLYRLYYSHPAVEGIFQWHFWSGRTWRPQAVLTDGPNITPNKAGKIVRQLVWEDWRTNVTLNVGHDHELHVPAFRGKYKLNVMHYGNVIHEEEFTLAKGGVQLTVALSGSETHPKVSQVLIG